MVYIRAQRKGKGSLNWRATVHRAKGPVYYPKEDGTGEVVNLIRDPGRTAPLARVKLENGRVFNMIAPETLCVGDKVSISSSEKPKTGNVLKLSQIPEGTPIYNIENVPGDGGKFVRSSGTFGTLVSQGDKIKVKLPSKKLVDLNPNCRATDGKIGGGGRLEKSFYKAGRRENILEARGKKHSKASAVAMNVRDHPFGGSAKPGRTKSVKRSSPPGQKVGTIAPKRTGKKKR
jgi:large subunit ribosomal protein L2